MNKEYEVVYCKDCNTVKITEDDRSCLICKGTSEVIGFEHRVIQQLIEVENNE